MRRVDRYILGQLAIGLIAVTLGLALLVWLTQSLRFIELVLDRGLGLLVFLELTSLLLPSFFAVILPITTFMVILSIYVRLSSDRELTVMRAAGLSQWQLARPALLIAGIATALGFLLQAWLVPLAHGAFRVWQFEIRNQMAAILLQEGVFSSVGENLTVYVRERTRDGTLHGILVHDSRERGAPATVIAEEGRLVLTPTGPRVVLLNGVRQQLEAGREGEAPRLSTLSFAENSIDLASGGRPEERRNRDARERSIGELLSPDPDERLAPRELRRFRAEGHQRLAAPLTTLSLALIALAVALGGEFRRQGGLSRILLGTGLVVAVLAAGLAAGNLAVRDNHFIPLIWLQAVGPGLAAAAVLLGLLPRGLRVRAGRA
jgi:lipopolysaccharide export system permease protein